MRPTNTLSLFCSLLLAAGTGHAQDFRVGVKAGLNASTYAGANLPDTDYRLGPAAGILLPVPVGPHVDLQPELLYEQRGATLTYTGRLEGANFIIVDYTRVVRSRLHYVSLPVLVRVHHGSWFAVAGPQLSYLLAEQRKTEDRAAIRSTNIDPLLPAGLFPPTVRNTQDYHRVELDYVLGLGYEITPHWRVEGRYTAGATKVRQRIEVAYDTVYGPDRLEQARNSSLQLQVSYLLSAL